MLFADSETQKLLRDTARSFLRDRYPWERLYALERGEAQLSASDMKEFADLGWLGLLVPESAGGGGASLLEAAVVIEELGYAGVPAPVSAAGVAAYLLGASDTPEAASHLAELASGARLYTVPEGARVQSDGCVSSDGGRLSGTIKMVPFGSLADFAVGRITREGEPALAVLSLDQARSEPLGMLDRADYCDLHFDNAVSVALLLVRGSQAEELYECCDALSTAFGLMELAGLMQRVTEMTAEYISNRVQFGQPIAKFQAARHHAADMLMQTQTARWTAYHALWSFECDPSDTAAIWLAKHWAIRAAQTVFELAHLLHGGVGVGTEYPLHLLTQGVAALAVRSGSMNEVVKRINGGLGIATSAA